MASRSIPRFLVMFMILSCGNCGAFARTKEATPNAFGANRHESGKQNGFARESPARIATGLQARRELTQMIPSFGFFFASIRVIRGLFEAKTTNRDPAEIGRASCRE